MTNENQPIVAENLPVETPAAPTVPWSLRDTWIGFGLFVLLYIGFGLVPLALPKEPWILSLYILVYQPLQFLPILFVLRKRNVTWADLGFQKATPNVLALGCGLTILLLGVNLVNNLVMWAIGVQVQAQEFAGLFDRLDQPGLFLFMGVVIAPLFEEATFRGFLFGGLRQKFGWQKSALISSVIFGAGHLSIAAFIPTFALGLLFSYLYQKSNSLWPGIIIHTVINAFSLCALFTVVQYIPNLL